MHIKGEQYGLCTRTERPDGSKKQGLLNLTKRQLICFGGGALIGVPLFFLLKQHISTSAAALCMIFVMLPCFLLAMYENRDCRWKRFFAI